MKQFLKTAYLAAVLGIALFVTFCSKPNLTDSHELLTPAENISMRDDTSDVCTMPTRDSIRLNIPIVDGILTFADHAAMINALDVLSAHDIDDVVEWENRVGFKSLFSEYLRIRPLSKVVYLRDGQIRTDKGFKGFGIQAADGSEAKHFFKDVGSV